MSFTDAALKPRGTDEVAMSTTLRADELVINIQKGHEVSASWAALTASFPETASSYRDALAAAAMAGSVSALTQLAGEFIGRAVAYVVEGVTVFTGVLEYVKNGQAGIRQPSAIEGHKGYLDEVRVDLMRPVA